VAADGAEHGELPGLCKIHLRADRVAVVGQVELDVEVFECRFKVPCLPVTSTTYDLIRILMPLGTLMDST
jgi:hypothetical protein